MVRRMLISATTSEDEVVIDATPKKHKKHKHKKHKKRKHEHEHESDTSIDVSYEDGVEKPHRMKTKGRELPGASAAELLKAQTMKASSDARRSLPGTTSSTPPKASKKKKKGRDSGTSSEEERWLDAIKSGKLEEVDDELKKIKPKDPKMMTARQRAMYERGSDKEPALGGEVLMALPSGYKEKVMTAEAIQKAALKSQKRKQMADEKREKDKKKTMERLLKKQESKTAKYINRPKPQRGNEPRIMYKMNLHERYLALPPAVEFPLEPQLPREYPKLKLCGAIGCENRKKYNCSKTGVPLCSLECYKIIQNAGPESVKNYIQEIKQEILLDY